MEKRDNLMYLRKSMNLTQQEMADRLGVNISTYNKIENGKRDGSLDMWAKVQSTFGLRDDDIWKLQTNDFITNDFAIKKTDIVAPMQLFPEELQGCFAIIRTVYDWKHNTSTCLGVYRWIGPTIKDFETRIKQYTTIMNYGFHDGDEVEFKLILVKNSCNDYIIEKCIRFKYKEEKNEWYMI